MEHLDYNSLEHLVFNASFKRWVLTNAEADAAYWAAWQAGHPEKAGLVNDARAVILALGIDFKTHSTQEINKEISAILHKLDESFTPEAGEVIDEQPARVVRFIAWRKAYKFVAVALVILLAGYLIVNRWPAREQDPVSAFENNEDEAAYVKVSNTTAAAKLVTLPDGSTITLQPNSDIAYTKKFTAAYREVYLTGEAFFEVTKNPAHPFLVYTSNIVTRVLGTSFTIKCYPADKSATVIVKTGRVTVFKRADFKNIAVAAQQGAKVITANQQVIFNMEEKGLHKAIIEKPIVIIPQPQTQNLVFSATPVSEVFTRLEELYGLPIIYDSSVLANCSLSASLEDETFYDKLDIICKAINATYVADDGNIIISAKGCK